VLADLLQAATSATSASARLSATVPRTLLFMERLVFMLYDFLSGYLGMVKTWIVFT
jgi:hypothetical protein